MKIWHICLLVAIIIGTVGYGKQYYNDVNGSGIYEYIEGEQREYQCEPWELIPEQYVSYMVINDDYFNATLVRSCRVYNDWIATMPTYFLPMGIILAVFVFFVEREPKTEEREESHYEKYCDEMSQNTRDDAK